MWRMSVLSIFLAVVSHGATTGGSSAVVHAWDETVSGTVDVERFEKTGDVTFFDGLGELCTAETGPAPSPYPPIRFLGPRFEQLGASDAGMDGIWFYTRGKHSYWRTKQEVFVVWKIHIPSAENRSVPDFEDDLTLSLWVDWDQDTDWDRDELVIRKTFNIRRYLPTSKQDICLSYLTSFRVPNVSRRKSPAPAPGRNHNRDLTHLWVRGSLSYANPVVSPGGDQLYGDFEDYRVGYRADPGRGRKNKDGS